jgi:hypothetical protein
MFTPSLLCALCKLFSDFHCTPVNWIAFFIVLPSLLVIPLYVLSFFHLRCNRKHSLKNLGNKILEDWNRPTPLKSSLQESWCPALIKNLGFSAPSPWYYRTLYEMTTNLLLFISIVAGKYDCYLMSSRRWHTVILFCWQFVLLFVLRSLTFSARQNTWTDNLRKFILNFLMRNILCVVFCFLYFYSC